MTRNATQPPVTGLTESEIAEIAAEFHHYADKASVAIEALKIVQKHRRWISDEALRAVAAFLELSPEQVEGVATFYNLIYRQPVGRTVIHYCDSVSCWMLGADAIRDRLCSRLQVALGETSADGGFTVLPSACLGACDHAPVLMVEGELKLDVSEETIDTILQGER